MIKISVTTLNDFTSEKIQEKENQKTEDDEIMDLLGRFSAKMLMERLRINGHPEPEFGDGETWRYYYLKECSRRGIKLLKNLGWPTEEDALYVNIHTGCVERLIDVTVSHEWHTIASQVWSVIEHWEPYDETKPNMYLVEYLREDIERLEKLKRNKKQEPWNRHTIKRIPDYEETIRQELAKGGQD